MEWSKLLFKCIKPVGEPEFRLNGDIATHTITLHLEMTELDLSGAEASCTREDLKRYRRLGLTLEEVVEVSMKLNALKGLGVNLKIEGKCIPINAHHYFTDVLTMNADLLIGCLIS